MVRNFEAPAPAVIGTRIKRWEGVAKKFPAFDPAMFEVRSAGVRDASVSIRPPWLLIPAGRLSGPPGSAACGRRSADHGSRRGGHRACPVYSWLRAA